MLNRFYRSNSRAVLLPLALLIMLLLLGAVLRLPPDQLAALLLQLGAHLVVL